MYLLGAYLPDHKLVRVRIRANVDCAHDLLWHLL